MAQLLKTDSSNTYFIALVSLLDSDLVARNREQSAFYTHFKGIATLEHCVVYMLGNTLLNSQSPLVLNNSAV
ncbi:hypothetical protein [Maribacter antarcticus]|uniref:hypothetical protein n=1 Tax=Maribacter antarcticus TaxID=505250 RepID=UPI00047CD382|nr:hypothetical protein [Maribacter antarcticus]